MTDDEIKVLQVEVMLLKDELGSIRERQHKAEAYMNKLEQSLQYLWHWYYMMKMERK